MAQTPQAEACSTKTLPRGIFAFLPIEKRILCSSYRDKFRLTAFSHTGPKARTVMFQIRREPQDLVAPASRRLFCAAPKREKIAGETPAQLSLATNSAIPSRPTSRFFPG